MQQFDIDNANFNLQVELQYLRMRNRQRRRKALLLGLAVFSIFYVLIQPNQYQDKQIPYSQNNVTNSTDKNTTNELILNHFVLLEKLLITQFEGHWDLTKNLAEATFYKSSYQIHQIQLQLKLIEGHFLEDQYNQFSLYLNQTQLVTPIVSGQYIFNNVTGQYRKTSVYQNDESIQIINGNLTLVVENLDDENIENVVLSMDGIFAFTNDTTIFQFTAELELRDIEKKALIYSGIVSVLNIIQFISCLKLMKDFIGEGSQANQFSLFIFVFLMIFDGYLGIVHFFLALQSEYYLTPAFLELVLFFFLELKLAMHIWKERFMNLQDHQNIRRELYKFYIKFYLFAMILVLLLYYFIYYNVFLIVVNLYLVPQIIHVAYRGSHVEFDKVFVFGLLATRLFIPLYFRGCPMNVLHAQISYFTCAVILFLFAAQTVLYYYQCVIGPRFFLPKCLKPRTHEYFVDQPIEGECAICITLLQDTPQESQLDNKFIARIISLNPNKLMETPCGHHFHAVCLTKWMNVKLNCPTCRSVLPPLV